MLAPADASEADENVSLADGRAVFLCSLVDCKLLWFGFFTYSPLGDYFVEKAVQVVSGMCRTPIFKSSA